MPQAAERAADADVGAVQGRTAERLTASDAGGGAGRLLIEGLVVRYGPLVALDGDRPRRLRAGEMFVLLGGSGSGKTTLLRCAGGVHRAGCAGRVVLGGEDITAAAARTGGR